MEHQQPRSVQQQVESLQDRGMKLDVTEATNILSQVSYSRLKPYWWDMRDPESEDAFLDSADFSLVLERYNFDRSLRLILFEAIEIIEVSLRAKIINHLSEAHGGLWYLDSNLFLNKDYFEEHLLDLKSEFNRSKDGFAVEFKKNNNWIYNELVQKKVIVRNRNRQVTNCVRITIGTPGENEELLNKLRTLV